MSIFTVIIVIIVIGMFRSPSMEPLQFSSTSRRNPKSSFADAVTACDDSCWLRLNGYLFQRETRPIQKWVEQGLFETSVSLIETHHGTMERCTTKVTGKGQQYFVNGFITGRFKVDNQ